MQECEIQNHKSLKPFCPTRWCVRVTSLNDILKNYEAILDVLHQLGESNDKCATLASGLHSNFEKGEMYISLLFSRDLFAACEHLAKFLQTPSISIQSAISCAELVISQLENMLEKPFFEKLWMEMLNKCTEWDLLMPTLPRNRKRPSRFEVSNDAPDNTLSISDFWYQIYCQTTSCLINEIRDRFTQNGIKELSEFESLLVDPETHASCVSCTLLSQKYAVKLDLLLLQIKMFKEFVKGYDSVQSAVDKFRNLNSELQNFFPELRNLLKLLTVLPSSTATAERSFSTLRRLKTYLRTTMSQERLNHLAILHVYKERCEDLDTIEILEEFVARNPTRKAMFSM